jgi:hypothetical protein
MTLSFSNSTSAGNRRRSGRHCRTLALVPP